MRQPPRERAIIGASCEGWYVHLLFIRHNPAIPSAAILNALTQALSRERAIIGASSEGWYVHLLLIWHGPAMPSDSILNALTQTLSPGEGYNRSI